MMTGRLVEFQEQVHLVNARGDALPVEFVARPFADGSAHCMGVTGSVTLLDSRRELERALMAQRRRLQEVVDSLPMSIALKTAEGEIVMANARAAVLYGRPLSHLVGVRERELFEARHVLSNPDRETRALSQRAQIIEEETEVVEGSRRTSLAGTVPIEDGARTLVLAFALDITDRKRVEEELRRQREFVSLVLDSDPNCIFVKDNERRYVMVNRAWNSFTGLPASAVIGRRIEEIFDDPGEVGQMLAAERRVIETQATDVQEEWARGGDGQVRWFRVLRKPMVTVDGRLFILVISNDVTEQRRYEEQLVTARQRAEDASRAKSEFLANVSHEIRTPMNGILGMSDLMLATRLDDQQRQYMNLARSSAGALMAVIDELLDFSKIEAGKLIIEQVSFPLHTLISDAVKPFALQAFDKGVTLEMRVSPDLPLFLMGDPVRLRQVLVNLVGNAVKFTERGEVVVEAVLAPFDPNASLSAPMAVHFSIRDTGIGIAPDKLSTIFQPFTQADGSTTRRYGGTGLGLTISSRLVELMGGQIEVRSAPGQGSSFSFALQYTYDSVHGRESLARLDFETHRVLWVAPSGVQNEWFVSVLRGWKADVGIARNCDEALNAVSRRAADVVFIDEHALDEQAERLIDSVRTKAPAALIVVMTAPREELKGARAAMLTRAAGSALRRLSKPVALLELQSTFEEVRRSEHSRAPSATEELGAPGRKLAILLVEDNPINQIVALNQIEQLGHEVALAENGRDALAQIESARFDVVLMDVQMPIMDGLEATAELRVREQRKGSARMPVIAVTAHAMRGDRERCLAAGMDGYISKPFQQSSLVAEVDRVLAGAQAAESGMEPAHASSFNLDAALAALNHDHALLRQVASLFIRTYPDLRARTGSARDARDGALLRRMAHEIKGMGLNLGAVELGRVASETEAASTRGDLDAATRSADAMLRELVRVERVMREIATQTARSNG
jgi:PAS domain S-box-containing protein